jgi:DNA-binding MarR family transcriptional regulator
MNEIKREYINQFDDVIHRALKHYKDFQTDMNTLYPQSITSTELSIIKVVNIKPDIIIKEISESLSVPGSTLTSAIDRLEQKKLIQRIISKKNRHSFGLELTEEGKKLNTEHENAERQVWNKLLSLLDNDKERELLIYLLSSIVNKLDMR